MHDILNKLSISHNITIKDALKKMGESGEKILFVVDGDKLMGTVTDGDIRRWILRDGGLSEKISEISNKTPRCIKKDYEAVYVKGLLLKEKLEALPIIDESGRLIDVLLWSDVFSDDILSDKGDLKVPVLIMAGGKGTRLDPFTKILPKPLIPIGDKPIIEHIMDRFCEYGCNLFFITVNYKGKMIQSYFDHAEHKYNIKLVWEDNFLGTAGSLKLAVPFIDAPHFFVSNCDILIKADYNDIYHFHTSNKNDLTVVGSIQHVSVPFGVLEMKDGGNFENIREKPEYDFLANTGMYLVTREVAELIPPDIEYDFPRLMEKIKSSGGRVGVYPINQQSWVDIGQWQEYHNAIKKLEL